MNSLPPRYTRVLSEGKTDWLHLQNAQKILGLVKLVVFEKSKDEGGDRELFKLCESMSKFPQLDPIIFLFDRDNNDILKHVTDPDKLFKTWGNNVFSLALAIPRFRENSNNLSIEFLYEDKDLLKVNTKGRRLFLSSEFDGPSGNHKSKPTLHVGNANRIKGFTDPLASKIVDSDIGVFDVDKVNIALSKSDFAEEVANGTRILSAGQLEGFRGTLNLIEDIIRSATRQSPVEILTPELSEDGKIPATQVRDSRTLLHDHPPYSPVFVGRSSLIKKLDDPSIRVAAITGLGGEGKSALAAKAFESAKRGESHISFQKWGWCDCKELESTFHERLLVLLEELTDGREDRFRYSDETVNDTINRFIRIMHHQEAIVIFDNVDAFVDIDSFGFVREVKSLFEHVTARLSKGLVIFTCRPAIHDYHPTFLEIPIVGLSYIECRELVLHLALEIEESVLRDIHEQTKGHALLLNLIFGQMRSGRISTERIRTILAPGSSIVTDLNSRLLKSIWVNLAPKEKEVLYTISAFSRPQDMSRIERAADISYHKCTKLIRTLVSLRLVLEIDVAGSTLYDLHPIIRAKARTECGTTHLHSLTTKVIAVLLPRGFGRLNFLVTTSELGKKDVETYIECAEIAIQNGELKKAAGYLKELSYHLWKVGEEPKFIDLARRLIDATDLSKHAFVIEEDITVVYESLIEALLRQGNSDLAERYLAKLRDAMRTITQFIVFAEWETYSLWFQNDHDRAVAFAESSMKDIILKGEEVSGSLRYNYALALRDSGRVDEAIEGFCKGLDEDKLELWQPGEQDVSGSDIGNLGRCFYLKGDYVKALNYIRKSAQDFAGCETKEDKVNYGYALLWLADVLMKMNSIEEARDNIQKTIAIWRDCAPARLSKVKDDIKDYPTEIVDQLSVILNDIAQQNAS